MVARSWTGREEARWAPIHHPKPSEHPTAGQSINGFSEILRFITHVSVGVDCGNLNIGGNKVVRYGRQAVTNRELHTLFPQTDIGPTCPASSISLSRCLFSRLLCVLAVLLGQAYGPKRRKSYISCRLLRSPRYLDLTITALPLSNGACLLDNNYNQHYLRPLTMLLVSRLVLATRCLCM